MARTDLLLKLVKSSLTGDLNTTRKIVEAIIAEERSKQHNVIAKQLDDIINQSNVESKNLSKSSTPILYNKVDDFLFSVQPNKRLDDLVLDPKVRLSLNSLVNEHHRSELLRSYNLEPRNRVLLIGEPGNGKTSAAEALACEMMLPMFVIRYDGIIGSYLGETASRLEKTFNFIKTQQCVLFFDEFDAIGKERADIHETGEIKRVVSSLLLQIDKLPSYVVTVAATNHSELLDKAVWRRFQLKLILDKPNNEMIIDWLTKFEEGFGHRFSMDINLIAKRLLGLSFSEIEEFGMSIKRNYVMSLPSVNLNQIVKESLADLHSSDAV